MEATFLSTGCKLGLDRCNNNNCFLFLPFCCKLVWSAIRDKIKKITHPAVPPLCPATDLINDILASVTKRPLLATPTHFR